MFNKMELLGETDLGKQESILKYFYLIDTDEIVKGIKKDSLEHDGNIFDIAFEHVFSSTNLYNRYINPTDVLTNSFFGIPDRSVAGLNRLEERTVLLKLCLKNSCVMQGFFRSLSELSNKEPQKYKLTAPNEEFLSSGFFEKKEYKAKHLESESTAYQMYNGRYNSLEKLGKDSFSNAVLEDICGIMVKDDANGRKFFEVPVAYKAWIYFVFDNLSLMNTISRNARSNTVQIITNYRKAYDLFHGKSISIKKQEDQMVFDYLTEYYFGFSTVGYINEFLKEFKTGKDAVLGLYEGAILINILKQLSYCPLVYARQFFLKYAFDLLRNNHNVECKYLKMAPDIGIKRESLENKQSEEQTAARGLELLSSFFNTLNFVTIPVLVSTWNVVTDKLCLNNPMEVYRKYIIESHVIIEHDLCYLSETDCTDCFLKLAPEKRYRKDILCDKDFISILEDKLLSDKYILSCPDEEKYLNKIYAKGSLREILSSFLGSEAIFKRFRHTAGDIFRDISLAEENPHEINVNLFRYNWIKNVVEFFSDGVS